MSQREKCHDGGIRMTRLWFATLACVISLGPIVQAEVAQAGLEDILYEKRADHQRRMAQN